MTFNKEREGITLKNKYIFYHKRPDDGGGA